MAIGNVSFGQQTQICPQEEKKEPTKQTSVLKGTAVAGGVGAGVAGTYEFITQSLVLNNPQKYKKLAENGIANCKALENSLTVGGKPVSFAKEISKCESVLDFIKKGKYNFKAVGKFAGIGALVIGGAYLAYRGIKSLFTS